MSGVQEQQAARRAAARLGATGVGLAAVVLALGPLTMLVMTAWQPLQSLDDAVTAAAERAVRGSGVLLAAARAVTLLGDPVLVWLAVLVLAAVLAVRGRARLALFLLVVRLGAQVLSSGTKAVVDRARPVFDAPVDSALGASFPSGHTMAAASTWTALAVLALPLVRPARRPWLLVGALAVAAAVAASRVLLGVHYLSDVVGGLLLGAGWTAACTALLVRWRVEEGGRVGRVADAVREPS